MANRSFDWLKQAERDLKHAEESRELGKREWACFAAHQAAGKAVEALHLHLGQEAWGHVIARLLQELPPGSRPETDLIEKAKVLDNFYVPTRYPNAHAEGPRSNITAPSRARRRSAMPVRSLNSSVLRWPPREAVGRAVAAG